MGLLDLFTGESGRNMAVWGANQAQTGANQQRDYINTGAGLSLGALGAGYNQARGDLTSANTTSATMLGQGVTNAMSHLGQNPAMLTAYGLAGEGYFAPLGAEANRGYSAYGDAAGVNGGAGQDRARSNFRAGPGYQFTVNEGVNAATRAANASGMAASGNTLDATTRLGSNLADKEWDDYMSRLNPYLNLAPQIAGKRADIQIGIGDRVTANNRNLADLYTGYGRDMSGLSSGYGNTLASLSSGLGSNMAGVYGGQAQNLANITGAESGQISNMGQAGFQAGQTANANTWNAGMQIANLAANALGKTKNPFS